MDFLVLVCYLPIAGNLLLISYEIWKLIEFVYIFIWLGKSQKHTTRTCACVVHYGFRLVTQQTVRVSVCSNLACTHNNFRKWFLQDLPCMHSRTSNFISVLLTTLRNPWNISKKRGSSMLSINTSWDQTSRVITDVWTSQTQRLFQGLWPALKPILNHLSSLKPTTPNPQTFPS